jgi:hypothetical protein
MSRKENAFNTHVNPGDGKVRKWNAPVFFLLVDMQLEDKLVNPTTFPYTTFEIFAFMFISNFQIQTEKQKQERVMRV